MNIEKVREFCLSLPGATEDVKSQLRIEQTYFNIPGL